jgi:hypothetical protein
VGGDKWRGRVNGKGERQQIWWMCFVYAYENRAMKLLDIALKQEV